MNEQQTKDLAAVVEVVTRQLCSKGHGEVLVKIQEGRIILINDTTKIKP